MCSLILNVILFMGVGAGMAYLGYDVTTKEYWGAILLCGLIYLNAITTG